MKMKSFITIVSLVFALSSNAQDLTSIPHLDLEEDTTEVATINDIAKMQQKILANNVKESHYNKVWGRRSFFNIGWNSSTLESDDKQYSFKSDFGISLESGTNYRLHKKPIQRMVSIALDYSWLNLSVNHFKAEKGADGYCYDSSVKNGQYYNIPWGLEKYEASYGMTLGPSVTVAPFIPLGIKQLDYVKLQAYYHIGYNVSFLYMVNDGDADRNKEDNDNFRNEDYERMKNNLKLQWGHGMTHTFGFNISWKGIGVGYEHRTGKAEYKNINTDDFGKGKIKFTNQTSRVYITFRT